MHNVGVKNVSVEGKIGNYFWSSNWRCIEIRMHNVVVKNVSVEGKIGNSTFEVQAQLRLKVYWNKNA